MRGKVGNVTFVFDDLSRFETRGVKSP